MQMQGMNVIKGRLEQLATEKVAHQLKLDAFWAAHRTAPVEERATCFEELNVSRKRNKGIRAQIIALEALLGVGEGQERLGMLERELDKLELKSRAIHQVWKDLPVGPNSNWEDDVMGAQAKELMEEHDELMSRRGRLQDLLKQAAGIAPARLEQAIPDTEDGSTEPKKPSEGILRGAIMTVESIQQLLLELPASRKSERLRYLERLLGHLQEASNTVKARQDEIRNARFKIAMARAKVAKEEGYYRYLYEEDDVARFRLVLLEDELSTRAGEAACVVVDDEYPSTLPVPQSRRKLEVLNECLQYLHLKKAAMTTRLGEICKALSFCPEGSKLRVVLDVESENLENRSKRIHSLLIDMEEEQRFTGLHVAALAGGRLDADLYMKRVPKLPAHLSFEEYCAAHPLLSIVSDKGLAATPGDGVSLLESMESGHMTQPAVAVVKHLVKIVSEIYLDPSDTSYKAAVEESMDLDFVGPRLESVATMMDRIQGALLRFLGEIDGHAKFSFTQGPLETTRSMKLKKQEGFDSNFTILILEGRAQSRGGTEIVESICDTYIRENQSLFKTSAHVNTLLPALGMEISGCYIRFHALFYTDRICQKLLTPSYHFLDMWEADYDHMQTLIKTMHAFGELCHEFSGQMAPYVWAQM